MSYSRINKDGRVYCTKGEYKKLLRDEYGLMPDLEPGETWNMWFETYFNVLLEEGSARKVGNHYEVYNSVSAQ